MKELLQQLLEGQKQLFEGQQRMESRLERVETRLENVEGQLQENSGFIKALVHQSEYQKVQMDELTHTTARIEGRINQDFSKIDERFTGVETDIKAVADDVGFLARKVFSHDDVLRNLKVAR